MEELLLTYNEKPFVSAAVPGRARPGRRARRRDGRRRAGRISSRCMDTLGQDNVRRLSVGPADRSADAREGSGARAGARARRRGARRRPAARRRLRVGAGRRRRAAEPGGGRPARWPARAAGVALDGVVEHRAVRETAELLGDMADAEAADCSRTSARPIGPAATDALQGAPRGRGADRRRGSARRPSSGSTARAAVDAARRRSSAASSGTRSATRRSCSARSASPEAVPLLQPLLRGQRRAGHAAAVRALSNIDDPAAARAVHTVLRAAAGEQRRAVVEALVARARRARRPGAGAHPRTRATRSAPITDRARRRSARSAQVGDDQAVPALATRDAAEEAGSRGRRARALKQALAGALRRDRHAGGDARDRGRGEDRATGCCASWRGRADRRMAESNDLAYDDLVRRLAAAVRGASLYSPDHPLVQRGVDALAALCATLHQQTDTIVIGFIGDEVVVNAERLPKSAAALVGFARDMREREIEKITIARGVTRDELRTFIFELPDRARRAAARRAARAEGRAPHRHRPHLDREGRGRAGHGHRRGAQESTARRSRRPSSSGRPPSRGTSRIRARRGRSSTAWRSWSRRTARRCMALTALKRYDNYTFTHMVNVSVLAMAQARSLNLDGTAAARVRLRGADARHRQGGDAAGSAEQPGQAVEGGVRHHEAARRRRRAHPAADARDAGARPDRRLRAPPAAGSVRVSRRTSGTAN